MGNAVTTKTQVEGGQCAHDISFLHLRNLSCSHDKSFIIETFLKSSPGQVCSPNSRVWGVEKSTGWIQVVRDISKFELKFPGTFVGVSGILEW